MGSPIETWEGASAYFSFAGNEAVMLLFFGLAVAVTVGTVIASALHEKKSYRTFTGDEPAAAPAPSRVDDSERGAA